MIEIFKYVGAFLFSIGTGGAIVWGLSSWLGKVWASRILEQERAKYSKELESLRARYGQELEAYRSELDRAIFVTRVHFETEFDALKEVFGSLTQVRLRMAALRPFFEVTPAGETHEARLKRLSELFSDFTKAYNEFLTPMENLSPFYPREIYLQFEECRRVAAREMLEIQTSGTQAFTGDWYARGQDNVQRFLEAYNRASDLIRERISRLAVVRGR